MSWTSAFLSITATRTDRIVTALTAVLLFTAGYITGFWTAETRQEVPIVFESSGGGGDDILSAADLQRMAEPSPSPVADATEETRAAAATPQKPAPAKGEGSGEIVASVNGTKYYFADCAEVNRIKEENRVGFATVAEARDAGYEPSACVQRRGGE
jgi:hypothetical protein